MPAKFEPPHELPARLLRDAAMIEACRERDFSRAFELVRAKAGIFPSLIARRCDLTPSRVAEVIAGRREIRDIAVIERVADGLRIPGGMLGLAPRGWETRPPSAGSLEWQPQESTSQCRWFLDSDDDPTDPHFVAAMIERQLPQLYSGANFFGPAQAVPSALRQAQTVTSALDTATGTARDVLLSAGSRVAEFLGWLYQDVGDFGRSGYWSDRAMEWAQEAVDQPMQSYLLYRKANQAAAQASAQKAVGLARAAQGIVGTTPGITALAAQQEAQGHALMGNLKAAHDKFDEAHTLVSQCDLGDADVALDTSYCTPTYIEIQRAHCWVELGEPLRAVDLFEAELTTLPQVYRNDRGVYLARLARACVVAGEVERGIEAGTKALAIVGQTGSARTMGELATVAGALESHGDDTEVARFAGRHRLVRDRLAAGQAEYP
ncbi:hypothetical protein [Streptomyces hainanensis]|uniref:XRE family transcriptional regulator n=1 Tax=Streptomyces hainanensis TaxID=402648 RepID=A0A4R4TKG9_9ACTN|nr:hypothetical protein [Streptomyces hainanensis]TDC75553.1 hypothetical protein E1283_12080 [Streptomyces hainanensis]